MNNLAYILAGFTAGYFLTKKKSSIGFTQSETRESFHATGRYKYVQIEHGKKKYSFIQRDEIPSEPGKVYITVKDDMNVWRSPGRDFSGWDAAEASYKNPTIKTMILIAQELLKDNSGAVGSNQLSIYQTLTSELPEEMRRIKDMTKTLQGLRSVISVYENHFNEKYEHGVNVVYEISRVNILRKLRNEPALI